MVFKPMIYDKMKNKQTNKQTNMQTQVAEDFN